MERDGMMSGGCDGNRLPWPSTSASDRPIKLCPLSCCTLDGEQLR